MDNVPARSNAAHLFLWLTLAIGVICLYPAVDTQGFLSTGDHGRDFYAFERTLHGDVPYQDYWWVYGPLMPYYYAAVDFLLGPNMVSVLSGKALLTLASGMLIFLTLDTLAGGLAALSGAAWFFAFGRDFFFTFNHAGGITAISFIMLCIAGYINSRRDDWLWAGLVGAFILAMIKVNFGLAAIPVLLLTAVLSDRTFGIAITPRKKSFYLFGALILPLIIAGVYSAFLSGLSWLEIRQCMPYLNADQPMHALPWQALGQYLDLTKNNFLKLGPDYAFGMLVMGAAFCSIAVVRSSKIDPNRRRTLLLALVIFGFYTVLNLFEFLKSGVLYRSFWAQPVMIVWMFTLISLGVSNLGRTTRILVFALPLALAAGQMKAVYSAANELHTTSHYLAHPRAKIFIANSPDWIDAVEATADYLDKNVPANQTFFALPYDPIYYYLTARRAPSRMLIFFDHINISAEQERGIIREINAAKANYVVVSSRIHSREPGLGSFGDSYCPAIARYLNENFEPVAKFGNWTDDPLWAAHHGTLILKRKNN